MGSEEHVTVLTKAALNPRLTSWPPSLEASSQSRGRREEKGERSDPHPQPLLESGLQHKESCRCGEPVPNLLPLSLGQGGCGELWGCTMDCFLRTPSLPTANARCLGVRCLASFKPAACFLQHESRTDMCLQGLFDHCRSHLGWPPGSQYHPPTSATADWLRVDTQPK